MPTEPNVPDPLTERLRSIRETITTAAIRAGRDPAAVRLIGASKMVPAERVREAFDAGVTEFGENYVSELRVKAPLLPDATWHFIGTLQTNSVHHVAAHADVVQTLCSPRAAARLAARTAAAGRTLDTLIEIDLAGRGAGVSPNDVERFADDIVGLGGLRLAGLMTVPPIPESAEEARPYFVRLRELRDRVRRSHPFVLELSMGMSLDYAVAVEEGATMVRIGTRLFGERPPV